MESDTLQKKNFVAVGFLFNPITESVLLHHRDAKAPTNPNKWGFFGGKGNMNETPNETFIRELKEELNIDIIKEQIRFLFDYFVEETQHHRYVFYIESSLDKLEMKLSEGQGFDWISIDKMFEYDLHARARQDLETFLKKILLKNKKS